MIKIQFTLFSAALLLSVSPSAAHEERLTMTDKNQATTALYTDTAKLSEYEHKMLDLVSEFMNDSTPKDRYLKLANEFERVATVEDKNWVPLYYVGLSLVSAASHEEDNKIVDDLLAKAQNVIKKARNLEPKNSELMCLEAMALSTAIKVDVRGRGPLNLPLSNDLLREAINIDSSNPRAYYLLGRNFLGMPEQFGGGKDKAKPFFEQAWKRFPSENKEESAVSELIAPHWGKSSLHKIFVNVYGVKPE